MQFWYVYQDEDANTRVTYNSPMNMLIVHDTCFAERPKFAVRYMIDEETGAGAGESDQEIIYFTFDNAGDTNERTKPLSIHLPIIEAPRRRTQRNL